MEYNQLFKDILYKSALEIVEKFRGKEFKTQQEADLNEEASLIKVVIENYDDLNNTLNPNPDKRVDDEGNKINISPDFIIEAVLEKNKFLMLDSYYKFIINKYNIPQEKITNGEIDFDYIDNHFEEKDKLPILQMLFIDSMLLLSKNLKLVTEYRKDPTKEKEMIEASNNVVWFNHEVFLRCIWCEQYELSFLDYDTKKVRVKDAIQKIEAYMLEEKFNNCPDELLKEFDFIKKWLETHSRSLEGINKETYNQKVLEMNKNKVTKEKAQKNVKPIDYKERHPDGFTFKDWKEGKILFFDLAISQGVLTYEDRNKIRAAQKEKYWEEVNNRLEQRKTILKKQCDRSEAKEILIDNTIKYYEWYFDINQSRQSELNQYFYENTPITFLNKTSTKGQIRLSRSFFVNYIVNGAQRSLDTLKNAQNPIEGMKTFLGGTHIESLLDLDATYRFYLWVQNDFSNSNQNVSKPKKQIGKSGTEHNLQIALSYISFMKDHNYANEKIMNDKDYDRLVKYVTYMIEYEAVPPKIERIPQINTSNEYIRYTFYLIHKALYTTKAKRNYFIHFLHNVFSQFQNTEWSTTNTKFSTKPNQYDKDTIKT